PMSTYAHCCWCWFIVLSMLFTFSISESIKPAIPLNVTYENDSFKQLKHPSYSQIIIFNQSTSTSSIDLKDLEKVTVASDAPM
ncbi:unnamed protein product, partial [Schistosoma turkestanicum]